MNALAKTVAGKVGLVLGVALVGYIVLRSVKSSAGDAFDALGDFVSTRLNPASDKNFAYTGVNALGAQVSGQSGWTLGAALYDLLHPQAVARYNAAALSGRDYERHVFENALPLGYQTRKFDDGSFLVTDQRGAYVAFYQPTLPLEYMK